MTNIVVDKDYCINSFLALRHIAKPNVAWKENIVPNFIRRDFSKATLVKTAQDIDNSIKNQLKNIDLSKTGIMLSGGMDSAILATYLPKGSIAYTMRSVAEGSINEVEAAKKYADMLGLQLKVIDVTWQDYLDSIPVLAKNKKAPFHSIEPLIYKTLKQAKVDGLEYILSGENADGIFGGMDGLLSQDWTIQNFINRYSFIDTKKVLRNVVSIDEVYTPFINNSSIDAFGFVSHIFAEESLNSYLNASECAGVNFIAPFANMAMAKKIDLERIRKGESKYLIRELFALRYNGMEPNPKLPMPRAVGVWLKDWQGPTRPEFKKIDINEFKPDQKWLMFILEQFLNLLDEGKI